LSDVKAGCHFLPLEALMQAAAADPKNIPDFYRALLEGLDPTFVSPAAIWQLTSSRTGLLAQ